MLVAAVTQTAQRPLDHRTNGRWPPPYAYFIDRAKNLLNLIEKAMNKPVTDRDAENTLDQFGASLA